MTKIEKYFYGLLSDSLTTCESSQSDLDKKLNDLHEAVLANNQLLGFLIRTLGVREESLESSPDRLSEELLEELTKHSAEAEKWGES